MSVPPTRADKRSDRPGNRVTPVTQSASADASANFANETAQLIDDIANVLRKYMIFDNEHDSLILATQVLYTYIWDGNFYSVLYVYIRADSGSGKTRLLEILDALIWNSTGIGVRWTEATLFRATDEKRSILFDEVHQAFGGPEDKGMTSVFNGGSRFGGKVPRVNKQTDGNTYWSVFGPKFFSGQNVMYSLHDDTVERTVQIQLPKRPDASKVLGTRFVSGVFAETEGKAIRERCERWAEQAPSRVPAFDGIEIPEDISDRSAEAWFPVLAIAEMASPKHARAMRDASVYKAGTIVDDEEPDAFRDAVRTAFDIGFVAATDFDDKSGKKPPKNYGNLTATEFGWRPGYRGHLQMIRPGSFKECSIHRTSKNRIQLRMHKKDFARFWKAVARANPGSQLPDAEKMLRQLRDEKRLVTDGPRALAMKERVWSSNPQESGKTVIDITDWYSSIELATPWENES